MVVFNPPYSGNLTVNVPQGIKITGAVMTGKGENLKVTETARNEYNVGMPVSDPGEPFVVRLQVEETSGSSDKYRDALT